MSAAKRIERDAIRFIMQVQIQASYATGILLDIFILTLLLPSTAEGLIKLHESQTLIQLGLH
jgi:hypothetical protein